MTILAFILPCEQYLVCLWVLKNIVECIQIYKCIFWMYMNNHITCDSNIILSINGLNIMVALKIVYLNILNFFVRYLLNILCPSYILIHLVLLSVRLFFSLFFFFSFTSRTGHSEKHCCPSRPSHPSDFFFFFSLDLFFQIFLPFS